MDTKHGDEMWKQYERFRMRNVGHNASGECVENCHQRRVEGPRTHSMQESGPQDTSSGIRAKKYIATDDGFREVIVAGGEQTPETRQNITRVMDSLKELLLEKNRRYGDSALKPLGIFTHHAGDSKAGILWRLDDKLSRVAHSDELRRNDVCDIMGYLCLLCVDKGWTDFSGELD